MGSGNVLGMSRYNVVSCCMYCMLLPGMVLRECWSRGAMLFRAIGKMCNKTGLVIPEEFASNGGCR